MSGTDQILQIVEHVASLLGKQSDQVLQEQLGIGLAQYKILHSLQADARITQKDIARNLAQTEASISRQVKLMLGQGLLHSLRSSKDRREHLTVVTPKGERLAEAALAALNRYHHPTIEALSDKQQEQLFTALQLIHQQICAQTHPEPKAGQTVLSFTK